MRSTLLFIGLMLMSSFVSDALAQKASSSFEIGDTVPDFSGVDQLGEEMNLYQTIAEGPVVLIFYRGSWCPYCNQQLSQLEDSLSFITKKGGTVIAVTPEKPEGIQETIKNTKASFKIIHDEKGEIMDLFDVGFTISDEIRIRYEKRGRDLKQINGASGLNLPVPATYVINKDRKVLYAFYDPNYKRRATVGKILEHL